MAAGGGVEEPLVVAELVVAAELVELFVDVTESCWLVPVSLSGIGLLDPVLSNPGFSDPGLSDTDLSAIGLSKDGLVAVSLPDAFPLADLADPRRPEERLPRSSLLVFVTAPGAGASFSVSDACAASPGDLLLSVPTGTPRCLS